MRLYLVNLGEIVQLYWEAEILKPIAWEILTKLFPFFEFLVFLTTTSYHMENFLSSYSKRNAWAQLMCFPCIPLSI